MQKRRPRPKATGIILLKELRRHEWIFQFPRLTEEVDDRLDAAIDWMRCNVRMAKGGFRDLIREYPEHLDAYHHLALTWYRQGRMARAAEAWRDGVKLALKLFPARFSMKRDRLLWGFIENRPFLRLYHGYGIALLRRGQPEPALEVFNNLLSLNPNDNQGVRAMVVEANFELGRSQAVLDLCDRYPHDGLEQLMFGRPLAFFQLGRLKEASRAFRRAAKSWPLIARELVKTRHPRRSHWDADERVALGSEDQAYAYWREHGKFWRNTPGALTFARTILGC
ncbi:MAG: tetratricopeptide repeat protein [Verrucomicrobia bacterium]|nr:tetratricopeptide repeat protein [Verrucomicrobiota bacterium]